MYLTKPKKIEDLIVRILLQGESRTISLLKTIRSNKGFQSVTKQGFYVALRKLTSEGIIIIYNKNVSINTNWLREMESLFKKSFKLHASEPLNADFLSLSDRETATYTFNSIKNMDVFWGHTWNILMQRVDAGEPVYVYDPHYWFYLAQKDLEKIYHEEIISNGRKFLMTVSGTTKLDKEIKKEFQPPHMQCNFSTLYEDESYYMTVFGDYICETYLDTIAVDCISEIFKNNKSATREVVSTLRDLLGAKIPCRLKITRNRIKAEKIKKKLSRNFSMPKRS